MVEGTSLLERNCKFITRLMMRTLGNALVWIALLVALPGVIYAMTAGSPEDGSDAPEHRQETCPVCRHFRDMNLGRVPNRIVDENMIEVSPAHPVFANEEL